MKSINKKEPEAKGMPKPFSRQPGHASQSKAITQVKTRVPVATVKRPVAPPVYKPQTQQKAAQAKQVAPPPAGVLAQSAKRPVAPPAFRPLVTPPIAQTKTTNAAPKVVHTKQPPAQRGLANQPPRQPVAPSAYRQTIQRAEDKKQPQIPGFAGFYEGPLPKDQLGGGFNTVYSQIAPLEQKSSAMSYSSAEFTQQSMQHLVKWAGMVHFVNEENTHAEDRLYALVHQQAILLSFSKEAKGKVPPVIGIPGFFVSASPCSSYFGTSAKKTGCTENLIEWATNGLPIVSEQGHKFLVKVKIGLLVVHHLYKGNTYEGAARSMAALKLLKAKGAIGSWSILHDPSLKQLAKIGYQKMG